MFLTKRILALFILTVSTVSFGQSASQEDLGTITASQVASGLGWNIGSSEVEFQAAAAAGATHVRLITCTWGAVEGQTAPPNNASTGFSLPPACVASLNLAKKYNLLPTLLAAYGAPYHQILTVTLPSGAAAGTTSIPVEYSSGVGGKTLSSVVYPYSYLGTSDGTIISYKRSYAGALITGVTATGSGTATLTLASSLINALAPGSTLVVNEVLYPSPATGSPTDPSVVAYANYAQYLAKQVNAFGLTGDVELWNEPPWINECWDNRRDCYDVDPQIPNELPGKIANFGFVAALQLTQPVAGVPYIWAGANKTSSGGVLSANMLKASGQTFIQPQPTVKFESFHPYGNNPEDSMWNEPCLLANPNLGQHCNTILANNGNMVLGESATLNARIAGGPNYGIHHVITETGTSSANNDPPHIARFTMRQFLGSMANDISYVEFYRLVDPSSTPGETLFSFITPNSNGTSYTPLPSYTALAGLMSDLAPMKGAPVTTYSAASLPQVTSYSGTYNLDHLSIVGARPGDTANSILFTLWQRSQWQLSGVAIACNVLYTTPCWGSVPQPAEAYTTVTIPAGMKVDQAINLDTRALISYSQSGASVTLPVSDDPVELLFIPSSDGAAAAVTPKLLFAAVPTQKQGSTVAVVASSISKGVITYSIASGSATISGNSVTATGPGTVTVTASQAPSANYTGATATTSFIVTAVTPVISFTQINPRTFGDAVNVHAVSQSSAPITYSIVSGPATISGTAVTLTGVGTVVVGGSQVSSGVYTPATATMSFTVAAKKPLLVFDSIPSQTYGHTLQVNATSASSGPVTYTVTSGPATLSGSTVSYTSSGQVVLTASQAASGGYSAATAAVSFHVGTTIPTLTFAPISTTPYNTAVTLSATSPSPVAPVYSIVSGPARIAGSVVTTLSTPGTVVVAAYQPGANGYGPASATTSFTVSAAVKPTLTFAGISSKNAGDVFTVSASSASNGTITYTVLSGPASISGSTVTTTGAGSVVVQASQAASGNYGAATATATVQVTSAAVSPTLVFATVSSKTAGDVFTVGASSASKGAITYSVLSGPATSAGSIITTTGAGSVVIQASQAASDTYKAATATITVQVAALSPTLAFGSIPSVTAGDSFMVSASSASKGAISYAIVSGPATLSSSTVTTTGAGPVVIQASQIASGNYAAASATTTVQVAPTASLAFSPITAKNAGDIFTATVTSPSNGAVTYSVASGPAIMLSGSTFEVTGAGTVVLNATQVASGSYKFMGTQTSFVATGNRPATLLFEPIPNQFVGSVFTAKATSASPGSINYAVLSGSASVSGSQVTVTGTPGTIVLQANQVASGSYPAASTTITVTVKALAASLVFAGISPQTAGSVFPVTAASPSNGHVQYRVVSGPATISGSTVSITGSGNVVLRADQEASGAYGPAHAFANVSIQ